MTSFRRIQEISENQEIGPSILKRIPPQIMCEENATTHGDIV